MTNNPRGTAHENGAPTVAIRDTNRLNAALDPLTIATDEFKQVTPSTSAGAKRIEALLKDANGYRLTNPSTNGQYLNDEMGKKLATMAHSQTNANGAREAAIVMAILHRTDEIVAAQKEGKFEIPTLKTSDFPAYANLASDPRFKSPKANTPEPQSTILVKSGDTLSQFAQQNEQLLAIARKAMGREADRADALGTVVSALAATNNISNINRIQAGQTLTLPSEEKLLAHIQELRVAGKIDAQGNFAQNGHRPEPTVVAQATPPTRPSPSRGGHTH